MVGVLEWIHLANVGDHCQALVKMVTNLVLYVKLVYGNELSIIRKTCVR